MTGGLLSTRSLKFARQVYREAGVSRYRARSAAFSRGSGFAIPRASAMLVSEATVPGGSAPKWRARSRKLLTR
jgi:hypothetical protein